MELSKKFCLIFLMSFVVTFIHASCSSFKTPLGKRKEKIKKIGEWKPSLSSLVEIDEEVTELTRACETLNQQFPGISNQSSNFSVLPSDEQDIAAVLLGMSKTSTVNHSSNSSDSEQKQRTPIISGARSDQSSRFLNLPGISPYSPLQYGWQLPFSVKVEMLDRK